MADPTEEPPSEPDDASHGEVPADLLELHQILEYEGTIPVVEVPYEPPKGDGP